MMKIWNKPKITFSTQERLLGVIPHPQRAMKFMPDWLKALPRDVKGGRTVKTCVPVLDAVSNGYVIPLWADLKVSVTSQSGEFILNVEFPLSITRSADEGMVGHHDWEQVGDACPLKDMSLHKTPLKLTNPWDIKTSDGYSVLIKTPAYNDHHLHILEGVVDTDTFNVGINFPFIWTGSEVGEWLIPKGTPLAQVIPFKRIQPDLVVRATDEKTREIQMLQLTSEFNDRYRYMFWHKRKNGKR